MIRAHTALELFEGHPERWTKGALMRGEFKVYHDPNPGAPVLMGYKGREIYTSLRDNGILCPYIPMSRLRFPVNRREEDWEFFTSIQSRLVA